MASILNADTSNGLKITSDTSGEIKLQSAGADIATVTSGGIAMASGKQVIPSSVPNVFAHNADSQSITINTPTLLTYSNTDWNIGNFYDTSTYRFTPNVAGYYQYNAAFSLSRSGGQVSIFVRKNGSTILAPSSALVTEYSANIVSGLVYLNGTTDYLSPYGYWFASGGSGSLNTLANRRDMYYFQAYLAIPT